MRPSTLLLSLLLAVASLSAHSDGLRFALVRTSGLSTLDALTLADGSWTEKVRVNHTALLIQHHAATLLFDTGLGRQAKAQFRQDMPWWDKPLFRFGDVLPVADQLAPKHIHVDRIYLSHAHWDHASGLVDFPDVPVWAPYAEIDYAHIGTPPAVFPSEFSAQTPWRPYVFEAKPFLAFDESLDLFGDGSLVLVPMPGHTPGSVGLFVTLDDGRRFFFSGDTSWRLEGFSGPRQKFWLSSHLVDRDREQTLAQLARVHEMLLAHPEITVVPAHDARVQERLGYFPDHWVQ